MDEIFDLSKAIWAVQSRANAKDQSEISETEFLALDFVIKADEPHTVGDIQRHIGVLPAQMSRVIRSLETKGENGLIKCSINAEDKRKIDVEATPAGLEAHASYREMKLGSIRKMLEILSAEDREEFVRILRKIGEMLPK